MTHGDHVAMRHRGSLSVIIRRDINMEAIEEDDLKARILSISKKSQADRDRDSAGRARGIASAIGTETPATVLPDIRDINNNVLRVLEQIRDVQLEAENNAAIRHKELCTLLVGVIDSGSVKGGVQHDNLTHASSHTTGKYYYGPTCLNSGVHAISCVMTHLDIMTTEHPAFSKIQNSDSTFMDMKDWHVLVGYVLNANKSAKAGLRVPRPSDEDFKIVCKTLAASAVGRRPKCQPHSIRSLLTECPGIMNTVEWTRRALISCRGVLSPEREHRFSHIVHPFINEDSDLAVVDHVIGKLHSRTYHRTIYELKSHKKKEYMRLILEDEVPYLTASNVVSSTK